MAIDQELYRKALRYYREWNEAELIDRIRNAGKLKPEKAWKQYVDLWEFCVNMQPDAGAGQRKLKLRDLSEYYARIERFEQRRNKRLAKTTDSTP